jgi:hypothetical protein
MSNLTCPQTRSWRRGRLIAAALALLVLAVAGPTGAERPFPVPRGACGVEGTWLSSVDIGAQFFTQYSAGATGTGGAMTVEWIAFDPTLFGEFPDAVRVTQAMGAWHQVTATTYHYTWVVYGLDSAGIPLYSIRGSGTGTFDGCDTIVFDYVMEIFPYPFHPLVDDPVACQPGTGAKYRIPVVQATCEE